MKRRILVIGALGQVGQELTEELRSRFGDENVIASDVKEASGDSLLYEQLDVLNKENLRGIIEKHEITEVYQLAAILSATAEKNPSFAWKLNMDGLFNVLELAREGLIKKVFWPSTIAVFGPTSPRENTPQSTIIEPTTVYGISKLAGERWCAYYFEKYGVDVRSVRYPGLIGYKSQPGGGTTDYAVHIFHEALANGTYESFLASDTRLPMMYMSDAVKATIQIMEAPAESINVRSSYNVAAMSFSPEEIAVEIKKHIPDFTISYNPDYRQSLAEGWPASIDDSKAREDWNWNEEYLLSEMVHDMLENIRAKISEH